MYKDFIHIFLLSCAKATYLVEKRLHQKLNFLERVQLHIHLSLCSYCHDYTGKAELMDKLIKGSIDNNNSSSIFTPLEIDVFKKRVCQELFDKKSNSEPQSTCYMTSDDVNPMI